MEDINLILSYYCPCTNIKLYEYFKENHLYNIIYQDFRDYFLNDLNLFYNLILL